MRTLAALLVLVVLAACSEPASSGAPPRVASRDDPAAAAEAKAMAQIEAMNEAQRQQDLAGQAQTDALTKDAQGQMAAARKAERDKRAAFVKGCAATREARLLNAKQMVAARLKSEATLLTNAKLIRARCKLSSRATGAVNVSHAGSSSFRVSPEMQDDLKCGGLPAGIAKEDAYVLLVRDREGEKGPSGPVLQGEDHDPQDGPCGVLDHEAGLNLDVATFDDPKTWTALSDWTPHTP